MRFETKAIHVGEEPDHREGANGDVVLPIHLSSTFAWKGINEKTNGNMYSRLSNPTRDALEKKLAALENAKYGMAFSSGMSAITTILLSILKSGDHVVAFDDLYGGTKGLFDQIISDGLNIEFTYVDATNPKNIEKAIKKNTKLLWLETPTNPLMKICDISGAAEIAHKHKMLVVVDNTFASPYLQQPLSLGSDIVLHSTTKYINGHSDSIGGAIMLSDDKIYERIRFVQGEAGTMLSPFDCFLVMRGIKTLAIRMREHEKNAARIVSYLEKNPRIKTIFYPGLKSHPQHELAKKQMAGFGGMLSFELNGDIDDVNRFLRTLKLFSFAVSLGGVESLIEHPASMTHGQVLKEDREKLGISDTLIRMSVGIENVEDLISDLDRALSGI